MALDGISSYNKITNLKYDSKDTNPFDSIKIGEASFIQELDQAINNYAKGAVSNPVSIKTQLASDKLAPSIVTNLSSLKSQLGRTESLSLGAIAKSASLSDVVSGVMEAETTVKMITTIRDKIVNSYLDIMKMPI
ncbi:MAG: flagellar hook-basal body complex protein FliE [Alphaproteobacteria bacterium]